MAEFLLPEPRDILKFHTRWNTRSLTPYAEELTDLWAQNGIRALLESSVQGPMMVRFIVLPQDADSAGKIIKLASTYRAIFRRRDLNIYRSRGRILIDIPWQHDTVCLGDLLNNEEYRESAGLPLGIGMNLYRESVLDDLTDVPHLLVTGTQNGWVSEYLECLLISALMKVTPDEVRFILFSSSSLNLSRYSDLPYCSVYSSQRQMLGCLSEIEEEIDRRYALFMQKDCHNIYDYNEAGGIMSHRFVLVTEYDTLSSAGRRSAERGINKIAALGGNCGIHLVIGSVRPDSLKPILDLFPARVCMKVNSSADSIRFAGRKGAEDLRRHALYYVDGRGSLPVLLEGGAVSGREIRDVLDALLRNYKNGRKPTIFDEIEETADSPAESEAEETPASGEGSFWSKLFR